MRVPKITLRQRIGLALLVFGVLVLAIVVEGGRQLITDVTGVISPGYVSSALRLTVPIAFAGMGGIFAEKTGVINIGLEGLLIIGAFSAIASLWLLAATPLGASLWGAYLLAILVSGFVAWLFAVVCIRYKADQIIAGLAVWLIALGVAPFGSIIIWQRTNSPSVGSFSTVSIPLLSDLPTIGSVFVATPPVILLILAVPFSWYLLNRTTFGMWIEASGEDPKSLDTAGIDVHRVRYAGVVISGIYCGIGGAGLALNTGQFVGSGDTMVDGRGWIGLTTYLIGNYNPIGAATAAFLFAGLDALQFRLQQIAGYDLSPTLIGVLPYIAVLVVLTFVGRTRLPSAAGEPYESDE